MTTAIVPKGPRPGGRRATAGRPQATSPGTPGPPAGPALASQPMRRPLRPSGPAPGGGPHQGGDPAILIYAYTVWGASNWGGDPPAYLC